MPILKCKGFEAPLFLWVEYFIKRVGVTAVIFYLHVFILLISTISWILNCPIIKYCD